MNPSDLTGRDLDLAVARALGTYREVCDGSQAEHYDGWICDGCHVVNGRWHEGMPKHEMVRPAGIPELFAEIAARADEDSFVDVVRDQGGYFLATATHINLRKCLATGSTPNEALARLLLMVTKR